MQVRNVKVFTEYKYATVFVLESKVLYYASKNIWYSFLLLSFKIKPLIDDLKVLSEKLFLRFNLEQCFVECGSKVWCLFRVYGMPQMIHL